MNVQNGSNPLNILYHNSLYKHPFHTIQLFVQSCQQQVLRGAISARALIELTVFTDRRPYGRIERQTISRCLAPQKTKWRDTVWCSRFDGRYEGVLGKYREKMSVACRSKDKGSSTRGISFIQLIRAKGTLQIYRSNVDPYSFALFDLMILFYQWIFYRSRNGIQNAPHKKKQ